ncbi:MAG: hypothetical protein M3545_00895 [Acidobacteriota bacterium]|nr:hypothetical protein [Acidobacteriota bacterium]
MPEQNERPRPHGDPLEEVVDTADSPEGVGAGAGSHEEIVDRDEGLVDRDEGLVDRNPEENRAQAGSDAAPDASGEPRGDRLNNSDRADGRGSDANGLPAFDEADGDLRKKQYRDGAVLVSKI